MGHILGLARSSSPGVSKRIWIDLMETNGVPVARGALDTFIAAYHAELVSTAWECRLCPGAAELVSLLRRSKVPIGLATGNFQLTGAEKLRLAAELRNSSWFEVQAWGD